MGENWEAQFAHSMSTCKEEIISCKRELKQFSEASEIGCPLGSESELRMGSSCDAKKTESAIFTSASVGCSVHFDLASLRHIPGHTGSYTVSQTAS